MSTESTRPFVAGDAVVRTDLPIGQRRQGKVRDIYSLPPANGSPGLASAGCVLIIATDRISAFDVVMPTPIPGKGRLLTDISLRWFEFIRRLGLIPDHLLSTTPADIPGLDPAHHAACDGRMMLGRAARVLPVEFVVRGYLAGSGWKDYQKHQAVSGVELPAGLQLCSRLPEPIFTPSTKADVGHDEAITFEQACDLVPPAIMTRLRDVSLEIYRRAAEHAESRGIILADTKFEFGQALAPDGAPTDEIILIDEVLTPDSSRFWPADDYAEGREQDSFDKQYVRNYLQGLVDAGAWDKTPPGPALPDEIVQNTIAKYVEARDRLFG